MLGYARLGRLGRPWLWLNEQFPTCPAFTLVPARKVLIDRLPLPAGLTMSATARDRGGGEASGRADGDRGLAFDGRGQVWRLTPQPGGDAAERGRQRPPTHPGGGGEHRARSRSRSLGSCS